MIFFLNKGAKIIQWQRDIIFLTQSKVNSKCHKLNCKWQNYKTYRRKQKLHDLGLGKEFINTTVIHRRKKLIGWKKKRFPSDI